MSLRAKGVAARTHERPVRGGAIAEDAVAESAMVLCPSALRIPHRTGPKSSARHLTKLYMCVCVCVRGREREIEREREREEEEEEEEEVDEEGERLSLDCVCGGRVCIDVHL